MTCLDCTHLRVKIPIRGIKLLYKYGKVFCREGHILNSIGSPKQFNYLTLIDNKFKPLKSFLTEDSCSFFKEIEVD